MDAKTLLAIAIDNAKSESLTAYKGKKTYLLWDGKTEYTVAGEDGLAYVMKVEPNLKQVAIYLNGEKIG